MDTDLDYRDNLPIIVGIGASAGGLEALQQFFNSMSNKSGVAFVVVQHLSPDNKSLLAEILGKNTAMSVVQAENGIEVLPNCVYLIPPKNNLILHEGKLFLQEYVHGSLNHPIDVFLQSLAECMKERSIAVVLSGTGTDGTNGIKAIKEQGGLVIVQNPSTAKFDGMPRSAINTGLADFVLSPVQIAEEIENFTQYPSLVQKDGTAELLSDNELLAQVYGILKRICKIDYTHYKQSTVMRRIERRMVVTHRQSLKDYVALLEEKPEEAGVLGKEILIGVTNFFRDPAYFEKLKTEVIYPLLLDSNASDPIRIWSVGCSTGEEAYSIAILFAEAMEEQQMRRDVKVFATDVDTQAIEFASRGVFSDNIVDDVTPARLSKYFIKKGDSYIINKDIRKMIIFSPHNVFQDPPFGRLDLISCRNVMIYFQTVLQKSLFSIFHTALKDGGYLFLGKSEAAGDYAEVFKPICMTEKIYMHDASGKTPHFVPVAFTTPKVVSAQLTPAGDSRRQRSPLEDTEVYVHFLENYLPPTLVINESSDMVHTFGDVSEYIHAPKGKMRLNVFDFLSDDLTLVLSTAINRVRSEGQTASYSDVQVVANDGTTRLVDIIIQPVKNNYGVDTGHMAIIFNDAGHVRMPENIEKYDVNKTAAQRIVDLERELQTSQENLKATIGELETVNEELQAANEELLTANEELQSSNEELQSVNEELYTVNAEYQEKLEELTELNNDMSNFLSSTLIGILFIDHNMNIRKFTDYIGREFGLMDQDVGRPLQMLSHHFPDCDLMQDAADVIKTLLPTEREVTSTTGKRYTMRISPYRTTDNTIKGVVISIIDSLSEK